HRGRLALQAGLDSVGEAVGGLETGACREHVHLEAPPVAVHRVAKPTLYCHGADHISRMAASPPSEAVIFTNGPSSSNVIQRQHSRSTSMSWRRAPALPGWTISRSPPGTCSRETSERRSSLSQAACVSFRSSGVRVQAIVSEVARKVSISRLLGGLRFANRRRRAAAMSSGLTLPAGSCFYLTGDRTSNKEVRAWLSL